MAYLIQHKEVVMDPWKGEHIHVWYLEAYAAGPMTFSLDQDKGLVLSGNVVQKVIQWIRNNYTVRGSLEAVPTLKALVVKKTKEK